MNPHAACEKPTGSVELRSGLPQFHRNVVGTTPVPSAPVGPLHRSLVEALECVAARDQVRTILRSALVQSRLEAVPEDPDAFAAFVGGSLRVGVERTLGAGAAEMLQEQLSHVLALVMPRAVWRQATGTADDADELSGERMVTPTPSGARTSGVASKPTARADIANALRAPAPIAAVPSPELTPLEAPILFPPRATSFESGTQQKRALARVTGDPTRSARSSFAEVQGPRSGARAIATDVIVVSLDPRLTDEVRTRLAGKSRVVGVVTLEELLAALGDAKGGRIAVVLDTGVPSIDVPTFASLASSLPSGTRVLLWGTDERQKTRLVGMFPQIQAWVASGSAESPVDLLTESDR